MEEGLSTTKGLYKAGKRPKKAKPSGIRNYCCVLNCKSTQYKLNNKAKIKATTVFFFIFKKFSVNNALICEFHFESGEINVSMTQGKKTLKCNVVPTSEDLKKPFVESKNKPPAARKSLFEEIAEFRRNK